MARKSAFVFAQRAALCTAALAASASSALAGDIIYQTSGNPVGNAKAGNPPSQADFDGSEAEVLDWNLDKLTYRIPGVPPQELPAAKVRTVAFDPRNIPADLRNGRAALDRGDFEAAAKSLDKALGAQQAWAKADAAFLLADIPYLQGDAAAAEKTLAAFKQANPKSRWLGTASEHRARALLALNRAEDAKGEFTAMKKLPGASEELLTEADFWLAWIDEQVATAKNDAAAFANAAKGYEAIVAKLQGKASMDGLYRRAQVGRAACLIGMGKAPEAKDALVKVVAETNDPRALAAAHNKLGLATLRAAGTDKAQMKAALYHFLRVITLYGETPGAEDDKAEAHYQAGCLFRDLKEMGPDWMQRAQREWKDCVDNYPGSVWAKKSAEARVGR